MNYVEFGGDNKNEVVETKERLQAKYEKLMAAKAR